MPPAIKAVFAPFSNLKKLPTGPVTKKLFPVSASDNIFVPLPVTI